MTCLTRTWLGSQPNIIDRERHRTPPPRPPGQARIQDFWQGRAPRDWWAYMGWGWAIFDIRKHRFATFDVYCHVMLEWYWTTIQGTPVSLLSALETKEPAASARVPASQGWAPDPPPPLDPRLQAYSKPMTEARWVRWGFHGFGKRVLQKAKK